MTITREMLNVRETSLNGKHRMVIVSLEERDAVMLNGRVVQLINTERIGRGRPWLAALVDPEAADRPGQARFAYGQDDLEEVLAALVQDLNRWDESRYFAEILSAATSLDAEYNSLTELASAVDSAVDSEVLEMQGVWRERWRRLIDRIEAVETAARLQGLL